MSSSGVVGGVKWKARGYCKSERGMSSNELSQTIGNSALKTGLNERKLAQVFIQAVQPHAATSGWPDLHKGPRPLL